jgi:hypothetical protein
MKQILSVVSLVVLWASLGAAQQPAASEPDRYAVLTYVKVAPENQDAYKEFVTVTTKKFYQELLNVEPKLQMWSAAQRMFGGPGDNEYNWTTVAVFSGAPPEPDANMDAVYLKASGMSRADYQKKLGALRTVVGTELLRRVTGTAAVTGREGSFRVAARIKYKDGMRDEFIERARMLTVPMMQERVNTGEIIASNLWEPRFGSARYHALGVNTFKDLASAVKGLDTDKAPALFAKVAPGQSYAGYVSNGTAYSSTEAQELSHVIASVERAPAPKSTQ